MGSLCATAQKGEQAAGAHLTFGTAAENVGIGIKYQYGITDTWRIEPSLNYYFGDFKVFDVNANVHYLFHVAERINVYPLAGIGIASNKTAEWESKDEYGNPIKGESIRHTNFAVNLGAGGEYELTEQLALGLEMKYQIISGFNQFVIGIGAAYKF